MEWRRCLGGWVLVCDGRAGGRWEKGWGEEGMRREGIITNLRTAVGP